MHSDLVELGWTDDQWNRIESAVTEEAQRARVATQMFPVVGPEDPTTIAIPEFRQSAVANPTANPQQTQISAQRLTVNSNPILNLTRIAVNVPLRLREAADPKLEAALVMFRRAGNFIARIEDALIFNGRPPNLAPLVGVAGIPPVYTVRGDGFVPGVFPMFGPLPVGGLVQIGPIAGTIGNRIVTAIIRAINLLDSRGQSGPYSCALSPFLFEKICTPNASLVLPRDRVLPFLQGPPLRSSAIFEQAPGIAWGVVTAGAGNPIEIDVARDLSVRYLQTNEEPRLMFRVAEKVAVRIKEPQAIALLQW